MCTIDLKKLQCCNPWKGLNYDVSQNPLDGWYCDADKVVLNEATKFNGEIKPRRNRFSLTPCPVPWLGRWNNIELPWLVILSLNPGSYDTNISNQVNNVVGTEKEYNELLNKNLRGEAGLSDYIFSSAVFQRNGYTPGNKKNGKKVSYWIEKLYPLYKEVVPQPMEKEAIYAWIDKGELPDNQTQDFFDHILAVELCPYHTNRASQVGPLFKNGKLIYPSSEFNVSLVKYMLENNVPVIVARSWKLWLQALGEDYIKKCMRLNSWQNTIISKNNLCGANSWDNLVNEIRTKL